MAGSRYAYRLGWNRNGVEGASAESWVDIPKAELSLSGLRPNPAAADLNAAFSLPNSDAATLELLDVSGRSLLSQEVGSLGSGTHLVRLADHGTVAPGLYWLRLRQNRRSLIARGVVVH